MKRRPVKVDWRFALKEEVKSVPNIDGKPLALVEHRFAPEGVPTKKIYCYGCKRYFKNWGEILHYHKQAAAEKGVAIQTVVQTKKGGTDARTKRAGESERAVQTGGRDKTPATNVSGSQGIAKPGLDRGRRKG